MLPPSDLRDPGAYTCAVQKRCTNRATTAVLVDGVFVWSCARCATPKEES